MTNYDLYKENRTPMEMLPWKNETHGAFPLSETIDNE